MVFGITSTQYTPQIQQRTQEQTILQAQVQQQTEQLGTLLAGQGNLQTTTATATVEAGGAPDQAKEEINTEGLPPGIARQIKSGKRKELPPGLAKKQKAAEGDTQETQTQDTTKDALTKMLENLKALAAKLGMVTDERQQLVQAQATLQAQQPGMIPSFQQTLGLMA